MNILIVEDEKRLADVLVQIMREAKYQAEAVYDGQDGIDYALGGDYDVIILDVMLPEKGWLCRRSCSAGIQTCDSCPDAHRTQRCLRPGRRP